MAKSLLCCLERDLHVISAERHVSRVWDAFGIGISVVGGHMMMRVVEDGLVENIKLRWDLATIHLG
jgi:hypothetical protein